MGEHVENIDFCLDTQLNFMFSTCSPVFCCFVLEGQTYQGFFTFLAILAYCAAHTPAPGVVKEASYSSSTMLHVVRVGGSQLSLTIQLIQIGL